MARELLCRVNEAVAWREGDRVVVGATRRAWAPTARFVLALVTLIAGVNGVFWLSRGRRWSAPA